MMYHGNIIALKDRKSGAIQITNCGWETNTTKERLNGLIQAVKGHEQKIYQKNFNWYWDIDGVKTEFPYAQYVTLQERRGERTEKDTVQTSSIFFYLFLDKQFTVYKIETCMSVGI